MYQLVEDNRLPLLADVFTTELILGICWEETFFNNVKQTSGSAVGFGQSEPSEFWKLETANARAKGFFVAHLPRRQKVGNNATHLLGDLTDEQSIQVTSAMLCQLYFDLSPHRDTVLQAFAGVGFSRNLAMKVSKGEITEDAADKIDPLKVAGRLDKIQGWQNCEQSLLALQDDSDKRPRILDALSQSRQFLKNDPDWYAILFPEKDEEWASKLTPAALAG